MVEELAPVATPLASVVPAGWTRVLFVPVDASWTVRPATGFPCASRTVTVIVEVAVPSATPSLAGFAVALESVGSIVDGSPTKATVGCIATTTWLGPGSIVAVSVFVSAMVEAIVPVATPLASVVPAGWTRVLFVPVEASWTVRPATGFPCASRTVTVIVEVAVPSATTSLAGFAVALESAGSIVDGSPTKATVGCCATTTWLGPGSIVAVSVFVSAMVEAIVPVATPLASVVPAGWTRVLFVPVEASWTVRPATGFPCASRTVTVIVEVAVPSATTSLAGFAVALESAGSIVDGSPTKATVGCCATTTWLGPGSIVAVSVFVSAMVEAIVPVATPLASVVPAGWTRVLFVPVEASWTVRPATGFPCASRTVTVIVEVAVPSATTSLAGFAVALESAGSIVDGSPTKATVGCCATTTWLGPGSIVAVSVFVSAMVEAIVPVATPLASVVPAGWTRVLFVPVEASWTVRPATGFPCASRTVTVIVEVAVPSATPSLAGFAVALESVGSIVDGSPTNATVGCIATTTWLGPGSIVAVSVFVSAMVEAIVPVATPLASVVPAGWTSGLFVPVDASWTVRPATGFPCASRTVTVIVEVAVPSATTSLAGFAVALESVGSIVDGSPTKATVGCIATTTWLGPGSIVAVSVFVSAMVEAIVPVATPLASVVPAGWTSVLFVPVDASWTVRPATGFPCASRTVTVIVEVGSRRRRR